MKNKNSWPLLLGMLAVLGLVLAACGPAATEDTPASGAPPAGKGTPPSEAQEIAELVLQDLAEQQDVDVQEIQIVNVKAVNWPDASLGCPKPGMSYATVVTPGYEITVAIGEQEFIYHTGSEGFVRCEQEDQVRETESGELPAREVYLNATTAPLVEQAQQDLNQRFGIAVDGMTVISVTAVEWPDGSLGCPAPGFNYIQVVTPGYVIRLEADGKVHEYHTGEQSVIYCPGAQQTKAETGAVGSAKADLAQQLSIQAEEIEVVQVEAVDWPDASLGCPQPGMMYAQVVTPGYRIVLSANGQEYTYHADQGRAILCEE